MNNSYSAVVRAVALFPHEDAARPLRLYRGRLFASGYSGARSLPLCAPLAVLSRPLTRDELGRAAEEVRKAAALSDLRGRITAEEEAALVEGGAAFPPYLGLPLSLPAPGGIPEDAIVSAYPSPALILAVLPTVDRGQEAPYPVRVEGAPRTVFRAAYLANLAFAAAGSGDPRFSFEWEIGEPRWLPGEPR